MVVTPSGASLRRAEAVERVRRTALDLMTAQGFDSVTVEEIARHAQVSPSSVYRYVGTKEALVISTDRPSTFAEQLRAAEATSTPLAAFEQAALDVWGTDDVAQEMRIVVANPPLVHAFERQLLDQRDAVAEFFATRRGKASPGLRDDALAAAALGVLAAMIIRWGRANGTPKALGKSLAKGLATISPPA
ncbi:MAG: TetR/AcrR family transcriptional regulator [Ilumatobacter sp.]|uniref:TetR/AcrR family transcriptional regulator n=1 Tax=Ilumatobacter sp. TaxID=1967498 RepID=UPI00391DDAA6